MAAEQVAMASLRGPALRGGVLAAEDVSICSGEQQTLSYIIMTC
jgi:hypothetical protein